MDRVSMKNHARKQIEGKIFMLLAISIIIYAFVSVISMVAGPFAPLILLVVEGPIDYAMAVIYLGITNHSRMPKIEDSITGFQNNNFTRTFVGYLRYVVFTLLWSLLFVIPGIIKSLAYSQMFFLMAEDDELDPAEAQRQSMALMEGHKGEYFVLLLSFIPWYLLGAITLGLGFIWIMPYINTTLAEFHVRLVKDNEPLLRKVAHKAEGKAADVKAAVDKNAEEFDEAVQEMKSAVKKAGNAAKKSASKAVASAAESVEKSAKEIKKEAKKASK